MKNLFVVLVVITLSFSNLFSVYHKVGELSTYGNYQEIEISENLAFISDEEFGLRIYEINDPSSPILIGSLELEKSIRNILISNNLAYLLCLDSKLYIVDIVDPYNPILLSEYNTNRSCYNFSINDNFAYIIENDEMLEVVYIGNPDNPLFVSEFMLTNQGIGCAVTNNLAFVATYLGLFVYDISNPYELTQINWFDTGNTHSPLIHDDLLFYSGSNGLEIIDYTDPNNLQVITSNVNHRLYDIKIEGDKLYGANGDEFHVVDISNLQNMEIIQSYMHNGYCGKIAVKDNIAFLNNYYNEFNIIDTNDSQYPELLDCLDIGVNKIVKSPNNELMLIYGRSYNGLRFYRMDDPLNPENFYYHAHNAGESNLKAFYIDNEIACSVFSRIGNSRFFLYDLSDLDNIVIHQISDLSYNSSYLSISSIDRKDNYIYLAALSDGIMIIDISDPDNPEHILNCDISGFIKNLTIKDDYLYFVSIGGLCVYDISIPLYPIEVGYWDSNNRAEAFALHGDYVYLVDYDGGLKVLDVSDPTNPTLINTLILNYSSKLTIQPIIRDNKLIVSDKEWNEIFVYDLTDPAHPLFQSSYRWNKYTNDMEIFDNYLFCANGVGPYPNYGLSILDFSENMTKTFENEIQNIPSNLSNYPNPFNPTTTISFSVTQTSSFITLEIYNIKGQKVKQLVSDQLSAGQHSIVWNGDDRSGKSVGSGVYLYKLNVNSKTEAVKKCLLLK